MNSAATQVTISTECTDEILIEKIRRYWIRSGLGWAVPIKQLLDAQTPTTQRLHSIVRAVSSATIESVVCPRDGCGNIWKFLTRTEADRILMCPPEARICAHCESTQREAELRAQAERAQEDQRKRQEAREQALKCVDANCAGFVGDEVLGTLTLRQNAALAALLEFRGQGTSLRPVGDFCLGEYFSPCAQSDAELLLELANIRLIAPQWRDEAFDDFGRLRQEWLRQVHWTLRLAPVTSHSDFRRTIVEKLRVAAKDALPEFRSLMRKLCHWEANKMLLALYAQRGLYDFTPGEKTLRVIDLALEHFTLGQVWSLMYQGAAYAGDFKSRGNGNRHSANAGITQIEARLSRAITGNLTIRPFDRNVKYVPRSALSRLLFSEVSAAVDDSYRS